MKPFSSAFVNQISSLTGLGKRHLNWGPWRRRLTQSSRSLTSRSPMDIGFSELYLSISWNRMGQKSQDFASRHTIMDYSLEHLPSRGWQFVFQLPSWLFMGWSSSHATLRRLSSNLKRFYDAPYISVPRRKWFCRQGKYSKFWSNSIEFLLHLCIGILPI